MESKLFKKLFSMLLVVAMVLSMCPTVVFADSTEPEAQSAPVLDADGNGCPHCEGEIEWITFDKATHLDANRTFKAGGHYKLGANLTLKAANSYKADGTTADATVSTADMIIPAGMDVCFDLNGYTVAMSNIKTCTASAVGRYSRVFTNAGTLSILDSSDAQTGTVKGGAIGSRIANSYGYGGNIYNTGTLNLYSGTVSGGYAYARVYNSAALGGNIANGKGSTFNMYGGTISGGVVTSASFNYDTDEKNAHQGGGNLYSAGIVNIYGGTISGGTVTGSYGRSSAGSYGFYSKGGNIFMHAGEFNMTGGTVTGGKITRTMNFYNDANNGRVYGYGYGGNIYAINTDVSISDATITNGSITPTVKGEAASTDYYAAQAGAQGGNIYVKGDDDKTKVTITNTTISGGVCNATAAYYSPSVAESHGKGLKMDNIGGNLYLNAVARTTIDGNTVISDGTCAGAEATTDKTHAGYGASIFSNRILDIKGNTQVLRGVGSDTAGGSIYLANYSTCTVSENAKVIGGIGNGNCGGGNFYITGAKSTLTIKDNAEISGGSARGGGNIYANADAKVIVAGGTIKDGIATWTGDETYWAGGNLFAFNGATITVTGGTISGGTAGKFFNSIGIRGDAKLNVLGGQILATDAENDLPLFGELTPGSGYGLFFYNGTTVEDPSAYLAPCACYELGANGEYKVWHVGATADLVSCTKSNCAYTANTQAVDPDNTPDAADKHEYDENGYCTICGIQAMARVDWTNGTSTYYPTMVSALLAADDSGATVHVLRNTSEKWIYYQTDENGDYVLDKDGDKIPVSYFTKADPISNITISSEPGVKINDTSMNSGEKVYMKDVTFAPGVDYKMTGYIYAYGTVNMYGNVFINMMTVFGTVNIYGDQGAAFETTRNTWVDSGAAINIYGKGDGAVVWNANTLASGSYSLTLEGTGKLYMKDAKASFAGIDLDTAGTATLEMEDSYIEIRNEGSSFTDVYSMTILGKGNVIMKGASTLDLVGSASIADTAKVTMSADSTFKTTTADFQNTKIVAAEGVDGCIYYTEGVYAAAEHKFGEYTSNGDATCTADGTKSATCSNCQAKDTVIDAGTKLDHTYGDWQQHNAAQHKKVCACGDTVYADHNNGSDRICDDCGFESVCTHQWGNAVVTKPTCTTDGYTTETCGLCGETRQTDPTEATGHTPVAQDGKAADCLNPGHEAYWQCKECELYFADAEGLVAIADLAAWLAEGGDGFIAKLGHNLIHHDAKAPTCNEIGWDAYDTCSRCDYSTYVEQSPTGNHTPGEPVTEKEVAANCGVAGSYDTVTYCTVCEKELSRVTTPVPATGDHNYVLDAQSEKFICSVCQNEKDAIWCEACESYELWTAWNGKKFTASGHYYLADDLDLTAEITVNAGLEICLDLNGKTLTAAEGERGFQVKGTLNILDSGYNAVLNEQTGEITGEHGRIVGSTLGAKGGGIAYVNPGELNLYAGVLYGATLQQGGCIQVSTGKVNLYGGILYKGTASTRYGGNLYVDRSEALIDGTIIYGGTATDQGGNVYLSTSSTVTLKSGKILNGVSTTRPGGNVAVNSGSTFIMVGGEIAGGHGVTANTTTPTGCNIATTNAKSVVSIYGGTIGQSKDNAGASLSAVSGTINIYNVTTAENPAAFVADCSDYCCIDGMYKVWHTAADEHSEKILNANADCHDWAAADCTTPSTCKNCGQTKGEPKGHTETTREEIITGATCGAAGSKKIITYCSVCNVEIKSETVEIPATGAHVITYVSNNDRKTHNVICKNNCGINNVVNCADLDGNKFCDFCSQKLIDPVATVNGVEYETLEEALAADGEVVLVADIEVAASGLTIATTEIINLNGKTLSSTGDVFVVVAGGDLTINGNGFVKAGTDNAGTASAVYVNGGKLTINGGTYSCGGDTETTDVKHQNDMIYVKGGSAEIYGGFFALTENVWALNISDSVGGTLKVYGGEFEGYDPAKNVSRDNYLADQTKHTKKVGNVYSICENAHTSTYTAATFEADAYTTYTCVCGDTYTVTHAGTKKIAVATVNGQKYESLLEAWQHATPNATITLLKDVDMTGYQGMYVPSSTLTLDLNGKTLKIPFQAITFAGDNFTIKNGTIDSLGASYGLWIGGFAEAAAASNVTIEDVTVIGGINIKNATNVTLNNVTATGIGYYAVWVEGNASGVVINSGTYTGAEGKAAVAAAEKTALTVKGGTYSSNVTAFCEEGKHTAPANGAYVYGEHSYKAEDFEATFEADAYTVYTCSCGDTYTVTHAGTKKTAVATVNGQKFESFEDAISYANEQPGTVTVTLLADVEFSGDDLYADMILDLNGKTITATGSYVFWFEGGSLVVKDSSAEKTGMIDGSATVGNAFLLMNGESLTIESGKIYANNNVIYVAGSGATVTVNGGELKSVIDSGNLFYLTGEGNTITVNNGTFLGNVNPFAAGLTINGGTFTADVNAYCAENLGAVKNADGMYEIVRVDASNAAAQIGDRYYLTLSGAINAAGANDTVLVLKDVTENLPALKGKIVPANGTVTITATNNDWLYLSNAFEIGEGVTLNIPNGGMFVYYTEQAIIKGNVVTDALYLAYAGTKLTVYEPGSLTVTGETFIIRYMAGDVDSGLYIVGDNNDETIGLKADAIYFYQGTISAEDANIQVGTYWQTQETDGEGSANLILDNTKMDVTQSEQYAKATGNSTVTLKNGSVLDASACQGFTVSENTVLSVDATSKLLAKNADELMPAVAQIGDTKYPTLQAAIEAAGEGATITVLVDLSDLALTTGKSLTITSEKNVKLTNVSINGTAGKLTVSNLTFAGNSWINAGGCDELVVENVTANVTPANGSYTNSRSAFIGLGRNEAKQLKLTVTDCNIVVPSGTDAVLGWAAVTEVTISGNTFGSETSYQNGGDIVKFMAIADGAVFHITNNTSYSNYNGFVFAQNTTRNNAYTVYASGNTFNGGADHIWIEVSGGNTVNAKIEATSDNTINGNAFTAADIKYHNGVIKNWNGYAGVNVTKDAEGKLTGGSFLLDLAADLLAEGYITVKNADGTYSVTAHTCSFTATVTTAPTTATEGVKTFTCSCGDSYTEVMPVLPQAKVTDKGATTYAGSYFVYDIAAGKITSADGGINLPKTLVFTALEEGEAAANNYYANYNTDFYVKLDGLSAETVKGTGCYLAGYYAAYEMWVMIPLDNVDIQKGIAYPLLAIAGQDFSYEMICNGVKEFTCGLYLSDEFLAANPGVQVTVDLGLREEQIKDLNQLPNLEYYLSEGFEYEKDDLDAKLVAMVNGVKYYSLQAAIDAAGYGDTVTLLADMELESDLNNAAKGLFNIAADDKITLDLNGHTISVTDNSNGNFIVFYNYGDLTVKNGTIELTATKDRAFGSQSTVILNRGGKLTIESGKYIHHGGDSMAITVDNSANSFGDAYLYVNGGEIISENYIAVRMRLEDPNANGNPGNGLSFVEVTGGYIFGANRGIWGQKSTSANELQGKLTVTGGTIENARADRGAIQIDTDSYAAQNMLVSISGTANVKGALMGGNDEFAVSGGTFTVAVPEEFCAEGYQPKDNGDGTYGVIEHTCSYNEQYFEATFEADAYTVYTCSCGDTYTVTHEGTKKIAVATVNGEKYESLLEAWQNATPNATITLLKDVDMTGYEGMYVPSSTLTLDLNGKTLKIPFQAITFAGDNFTIKNGTIDSLGASYGLWIGGVAEAAAASNVTIEDVTVIGGINIKNASNVTLNNVTATGVDYYAVWVEVNAYGVVINSGSYTGAAGMAAVAAVNADALTVKGGTYSSNVTAFCEEGKHTAPANGAYVYGDHSYTSEYHAATNTENAYTVYTCSCGDTYTEVEEGTMLHVAQNVQTGDTYTDLQAALNAAAKGDTVKLLKDTAAEGIYVGAGKTVDLNGHKLTVTDYISASFATTHIVDSTNGDGLLVVNGADVALNSENKQLPLWTAEGVRFVTVTFAQALDFKDSNGAANENVAYYRFAFEEKAAKTILDNILANGSEGTGIVIRVKVNYVTASGMSAAQYFEFTSDMVKKYVNEKRGWDSNMFILYLNGVSGLAALNFSAEIVSTSPNGSSVVIGSTPISD